MTTHNNHHKDVDKKRFYSLISSHVQEEGQDNVIIEDWLAERLADRSEESLNGCAADSHTSFTV